MSSTLTVRVQPPLEFAAAWLRERLFEQNPESLSIPVTPTREFCVVLFTSKIEATIRIVGDMIGWEDDGNTVGSTATAAKQSILRLVPRIIPEGDDQASLYRFVLEHGDFGIHNMTVATDAATGGPLVMSIFDWETGHVVPAILSDSMMAAAVDLTTDGDAALSATRVGDNTPSELEENMAWTRQYIKVLLDQAPDYEHAIRQERDARQHLVLTARLAK